jgi:hypothetical protein
MVDRWPLLSLAAQGRAPRLRCRMAQPQPGLSGALPGCAGISMQLQPVHVWSGTARSWPPWVVNNLAPGGLDQQGGSVQCLSQLYVHSKCCARLPAGPIIMVDPWPLLSLEACGRAPI